MKYLGIILLIVVGLSMNLSWANFKKYAGPSTSSHSAELQSDINDLLKQTHFTEQNELEIVRMEQQLKSLQYKEEAGRQMYINLVAVPYDKAVIARSTSERIKKTKVKFKAKKKPENKYVVSMVFVTSTDRYAVVDGRFMREGEILKGKDKIKDITAGQITVIQNGKIRTMKVSGTTL